MSIKLNKPKVKINSKIFKILICITLFLNFGFYIAQSISFNVGSHYISGYQQEIKDLKNNLTSLETDYSKVLKLDNIEEMAVATGFQKTEDIKFIKAYNTVVKAD